MIRRLIIAAAALILAAAGTASVLSYVKGADARALEGMKAVSVLVASKTVPKGTTAGAAVRQGLLASQRLPASAVPADALGAVSASQSSLVLSAALRPGQLLLRPMLVTAASVTSGLPIPPGMMAVTAHFCVPEAVAGALQPDSQVAVFDTVITSGGTGQVTSQPACDGPHQQPVGAGVETRVVLSRVQVLSVGGSTSNSPPGTSGLGGSSSSQAGMLVTVAVSQADAEKLIQVAETGLPYLALLTTSSKSRADIGGLLRIQPSPTVTPAPAAQSSQGQSSVVITQPSTAPVPVIIVQPTPTPSAYGPTVSPCSKGGSPDAYSVRARPQC